jgi:hypothetical protein
MLPQPNNTIDFARIFNVRKSSNHSPSLLHYFHKALEFTNKERKEIKSVDKMQT